ncbi:SMI1/KNR4 family protein [Archangium sp.]|uniref:SMI1/KNR4 family protein n=1 Tax=Archangium sp. TaxID=1872627 RepID=UPI002D6B7777|nr:SMI1/KNR4 family protein [Archangium sp.]HYO57010.1 SMI1/KNR4 family protein [Archangium sp.]
MSVRWKKYLWQEPLPATPRDIARLEQAWGVVLPENYKQVIAAHQGMVPIPSTFRVGRGSDSVGPFLTLSPDPRWGNTYSALSIHEEFKSFLPEGVYPFATTPGGEYLCFDYRDATGDPRIVFMTVEATLLPVAEDFTHLLRSLYDSEA